MQPSLSGSSSSKETEVSTKQASAGEQQDVRSGPGKWLLPTKATPSQLKVATAAKRRRSKKPKKSNDSSSMTPLPPQPLHGAAATERSSERALGEYDTLPTRPEQVTPLQPPSCQHDELPTTTQPPPEASTRSRLSWIPSRRSSQGRPSLESSLYLLLARLLHPESTTGQQQPRVTVITQEPQAAHPGSQKTTSEAATPSRVPSVTSGLPEVASRSPQAVDMKVARSASVVSFERHQQVGMAVHRSTEMEAIRRGTRDNTQEGSSGLRHPETTGVSIADAMAPVASDTGQQGTTVQRRPELKRRVSVSIYLNPREASQDATATQVVGTVQRDTGFSLTWVRESKARCVLFIFLHCLSQALTNILIKQVVDIPKTKIAYYVGFGYMLGNMPAAFSLSTPFGPRHVQVDLGLRGMASLMSLMLKAEALRYIVVSDLAVAYTLVPVCVMVLSWYFLEEGMGVAMWTSVSLCLCGIVIVMRPTIFFEEWDAETTRTRVIGFLYAFGSAISLVIMIVLLRLTRNATDRFLGFNSGLTRTILALTMSMVTGEFDQLLDGRFLGTLVIMSKLYFVTVYFLNKALQTESGAFVTTTKFSGDIIFSVILQMAFLDLYPDLWTLGGIALVVISFVMIACGHIIMPSSWRRHRRRGASARQQLSKAVEDEAEAPATVAPVPIVASLFASSLSIPTASEPMPRD